MKRLFPLLAVAALVSILAACGGGKKNTTTTNGAGGPPLKHPGKVVIGFGLPAPSFWNGQASGNTLNNPSGFEYSLGIATSARSTQSRTKIASDTCELKRGIRRLKLGLGLGQAGDSRRPLLDQCRRPHREPKCSRCPEPPGSLDSIGREPAGGAPVAEAQVR